MSPPTSIRSATADLLRGWPPPVLDPAGPYAWSISILAWGLLLVAAAVLAVVLATLWLALFRPHRLRNRFGGKRLVWIGGIIFPVAVLTALLIIGLSMVRNLSAPPPDDAMRVRVTGEMWWWRVDYLDPSGRTAMLDANEIHIPVGEPVVLELTSNDVIHSLWIPRLSGKVDMIPGRINRMTVQADLPGVYGGQCAEFCGGPHALMGFAVVAHRPADFERWQAMRRQPAAASPDTARGADLFASAGCAACHRIAGTSANGLAGPDLTHVGSRRTLGAGILPNNRGTMMGWVGDAQAIKPGNRMPPYRVLSARELADIAAYLEAQK